MAYSDEKKIELFNLIISEIEKGNSLRTTLKISGMPSSSTFYEWLEEDELKSKRYARACELRSEEIFEEILEIADDGSGDNIDVDLGDGITVNKTNYENIQRSRLRVDARKWMLSKLNPKKYGDKTDITSGGNPIKNANELKITIVPPEED